MINHQQCASIGYDLPFTQAEMFRVSKNGMTHQQLKNLSSAIKIRGNLDVKTFLMSMKELFMRQESFRTTIVPSEDHSQVLCEVFESLVPEVLVLDHSQSGYENALDEAKKLASGIAFEEFGFEGHLLSRAFLIILPGETSVAGMVTHHLISDVLSHAIIWKELMSLYSHLHQGTQYPPDHSVQYHDYVRERLSWQNSWKSSKDSAYWTIQMDEFSKRPKTIDVTESASKVTLEPILQLHSLQLHSDANPSIADRAREYRVTPAMLLLAYFTTVLACWNKGNTISFRIIRDERAFSRYAKLVGFFPHAPPFTVNIGGNPTFGELIARTKSTCLEMFAHPWTPDEVSVQGRKDPSSFMFNFIDESNEYDNCCGLEMERFMLNQKPENSSRNIFRFHYRSDSVIGVANCRTECRSLAKAILEKMRALMRLSKQRVDIQLDELMELLSDVG